MGIKNYNKLVRDRIPEIIKSNGGTPITRELGPDEFSLYIREKLSEEMQEFLASDSTEELADISDFSYRIRGKRRKGVLKYGDNITSKNNKF